MRKTLLLFLSLLALSMQARQIIDLNTGQVSADTVLLSPERDVEYVEDGIIVTYKISKAALDSGYHNLADRINLAFEQGRRLRPEGIHRHAVLHRGQDSVYDGGRRTAA